MGLKTVYLQRFTKYGLRKEVFLIKTENLAIFAVIGSIISQLFGGFTPEFKTLVLFMAIDFITGLIVAGVFKKSAKTPNGALESKAGFKGISKKCVTLIFVMIGYRLDKILGVDFVKNAVIFAYTANELISIIENAGLMGVPIPKAIKKAIEILNNKSDI